MSARSDSMLAVSAGCNDIIKACSTPEAVIILLKNLHRSALNSEINSETFFLLSTAFLSPTCQTTPIYNDTTYHAIPTVTTYWYKRENMLSSLNLDLIRMKIVY